MPPHKINVVNYSIKVGNSHFFAFISRLKMSHAMPLPVVYCRHCASCEFFLLFYYLLCRKVSVNSLAVFSRLTTSLAVSSVITWTECTHRLILYTGRSCIVHTHGEHNCNFASTCRPNQNVEWSLTVKDDNSLKRRQTRWLFQLFLGPFSNANWAWNQALRPNVTGSRLWYWCHLIV